MSFRNNSRGKLRWVKENEEERKDIKVVMEEGKLGKRERKTEKEEGSGREREDVMDRFRERK